MITKSISRLWEYARKHPYRVWGPAVVAVLIWAGSNTPALGRLENITIDWRFRARAPHDPKAENLIVVGIDEPSLLEFKAWPWPRSVHGDFVQLLGASEPAVIAFDLVFSEPQQGTGDQDFSDALKAFPKTITGAYSDKQHTDQFQDVGPTKPIQNIKGDIQDLKGSPGALWPIEKIARHSYIGSVNCEPYSKDGIRRTMPMLVRVNRTVVPSLTLQALLLYWGVKTDEIEVELGKEIRIPTSSGLVRVPINGAGEFAINYRANETFPMVDYSDLFSKLAKFHIKGEPWPRGFISVKGKILVVGQIAMGLSDLGPSPYDGRTPLVLAHLNVLNNILRGDYLTIVPAAWILPFWLVAGWATLILMAHSSARMHIAVAALVIGAYTGAAFLVFAWKSIQLPLFWPVAGFVGLHVGENIKMLMDERKAKAEIKQIFGSFVSPGIMETILKNPVGLEGETKAVTVLFSDLSGFTMMTETYGDPKGLVKHLNEYFEKMVNEITVTQGSVHKFIGDSVMAAWGDILPHTPEQNATNAVRAALGMGRELAKLNTRWKLEKRPTLGMGIGLNHGTVIAGYIGSEQRKEFTVMGDPVNLAARLEGVAKQFKVGLAVSQSVRDLIGDTFVVRTLGVIQVKGKKQAVRVYEVMGEHGAGVSTIYPMKWIALYEKGFEAYLARKFKEAEECFKETLREAPEDFCSKTYIEVCQEYVKEPPPEDWNGVYVMKGK